MIQLNIPPNSSEFGREAVIDGLCFFSCYMKTVIYVDGFNLYYGALKETPYKWLDLAKLCQSLLPKNQILKIKYFTARVSARPDDPQQPIRQQTYLRALATNPNLEIIYGRFLSSKVHMRLTQPPAKGSPYVQVYKMEEKGSDVNLGVHLLHDGHLGVYDVAIVISNDSDLVEPIRLVQQDLQKTVGILNPYSKPSHVLKQHGAFIKPIRKGALAASQFPGQLYDATGPFHKPQGW